MQERKKTILAMVITLILLIIILSIYKMVIPEGSNKELEEQNENTVNTNEEYTVETKTEEELKQERMVSLSEMSEGKRMKTYFSDYMKLIEKKEYEKAYEFLYTEFKDTYFPTIDDFIEYAKNTYPKDIAVEYVEIQSQGYLYILIVFIDDGSKTIKPEEERFKQSFIFDEKSLDNYKLSFSVE